MKFTIALFISWMQSIKILNIESLWLVYQKLRSYSEGPLKSLKLQKIIKQ